MTDEVAPVEATPEQLQREEAKAFSDAFADVHGAESPAVPVEPPSPASPPVTEDLDPAVVEEALKDPELIPGLNRDQLTGLLARIGEFDSFKRQQDKIAGHIGALIQDVKSLKTKPSPKEEELEPVDREKFAADYPDFAGFTRAEIEEVKRANVELQQQIFDMVAAMEEREIARVHPDWEATVLAPDFKLWLTLQPPETQELANTTNSAAELTKIVSAYKDHGKKQVKEVKNRERLEAALVPTGAAPARPGEPSENDAFKMGWNAVAGRA